MKSRITSNREMSSEVWTHKSKIQSFYEDKVILLTGGTGFLGKILIEKLLRRCPNIRQIYLLMREKNGMNAEDRLKRLLDDVVFLRIKKDNPQFMESLLVVHGDLHKPRLGLEKSHEAMVIQNVDIVLHSAATLRFDEQFKVAITTNVAATKQLCLLAQEIINLKAFVYVSTAYSNCDSDFIHEKVQPSAICPEKLISLSDLLDGPMLDNITPNLIGSKPNTYIFTKCAAEEIVNSFNESLPVAILRPSIVVATVSEPTPGWIDNVQGSTGVVASMSAGFLRSMMCNDDAVANIVPVDYTANAIIALAYSVAAQNWQCTKDEGIPVINFVSASNNTLTWREFGNFLEKYIRRYPMPNLLWYPFITTPQKRWSSALHCALLHYLPANLIDFIAAQFGISTSLRKIYNRLDKYTNVVNYFSTRHFDFEEKNSRLLWESLEPQDQQLFPFNMADIHWDSYFSNYIQGCRQYLLKENPITLDSARRRIKLLYLIHLMTKGAFYLFTFKVISFISKLLGRRLLKYGIYL